MRLLVLGGTGWLGGTAARLAVEAGHDVAVIGRGRHPAPTGTVLVAADRSRPGSFDALRGERSHAVLDVASSPGQARAAVAALEPLASRSVYVSNRSVYADQSTRGAGLTDEEERELLAAWRRERRGG